MLRAASVATGGVRPYNEPVVTDRYCHATGPPAKNHFIDGPSPSSALRSDDPASRPRRDHEIRDLLFRDTDAGKVLTMPTNNMLKASTIIAPLKKNHLAVGITGDAEDVLRSVPDPLPGKLVEQCRP